MDIEPFLIASTVNAVIAQRLVRKLCPFCREEFTPEPKVIEDIVKDFGLRQEFLSTKEKPTEVKPQPVKMAAQSNALGERKIAVPEDFKINKESILDKIAKDPEIVNRSSKEAEEISLRNNIFLTEDERNSPERVAKAFDNKLTLTLYRSKGCSKCDNSGYLGRMGIYEVLEMNDDIGKMIVNRSSTEEIQHVAVQNGMITMQQDGFLKALEGITTVEEVLRVTRE